MVIVKKITVKNVGPKPSSKEKTDLINVAGIITGVAHGESQYGPWTKLLGSFKARNLETDEVFASGTCILPAIANDILVGTFQGEPLEFAVQISSVPAETPTGYEYRVSPLVEVEESESMKQLSAVL